MKIKTFFAVALLFCMTPLGALADGPMAAPSPVVSAMSVADVIPAPHTLVAVAEPAAPPQWAQDLLVTAEGLPYVGPVIVKIITIVPLVCAILTAVVAFLISLLTMMIGIFNYAGFTSAVAFLTAFQNGKFMYYLKYFSMFNAKKPDPK